MHHPHCSNYPSTFGRGDDTAPALHARGRCGHGATTSVVVTEEEVVGLDTSDVFVWCVVKGAEVVAASDAFMWLW